MVALNGGHPPVTTGLEHLLNSQVIVLNGGPYLWPLMMALNGGHPPVTIGLEQLLNSKVIVLNGGP
jgi:hypothetical protein